MVDNDAFRRHVAKGFRRTSRAVFDRVDPERAVPVALRDLSASIVEGGCPGFRYVIEVVEAHMRAPATEENEERSVLLLEDIGRVQMSDRTRWAVRAAKRWVRASRVDSVDPMDATQVLTECFLVDFVTRQAFNGGLMQDLVESMQESVDSYEKRCQQFLQDVRQDPGLAKLARELIADPDGSRVKRQRVKRSKIDQRELVEMALA